MAAISASSSVGPRRARSSPPSRSTSGGWRTPRRSSTGRGATPSVRRSSSACSANSARLAAFLKPSSARADDARMDVPASTWLCRTEMERARVMDVGARVSRARTIASASVGLTLLLFAPMFGWWTLALFALSALNTQTVDRRMERSARPERHVAASIVWSQLLLAVAVALSGGPASPALPWLVVPTSFAATRFRTQVVVAAVGSAVMMLLGATVAVDPSGTLAHPAPLVVSVALLVSITAVVGALSGAEVEQRSESVLDPLTGLLNRTALGRRFHELEEQAHLTGETVSLLICA